MTADLNLLHRPERQAILPMLVSFCLNTMQSAWSAPAERGAEEYFCISQLFVAITSACKVCMCLFLSLSFVVTL